MTLFTCVVAAVLAQPPHHDDSPPISPKTEEGANRFVTEYRALKAAFGWTYLDEKNYRDLWHTYRKPAFPAGGWTYDNGVLTSTAAAGAGDLITRDQYGDFEFCFMFKCEPKANSGVMYRVTEKHDASWQTGPEYQVLDDPGHSLKPDDPHSSGALYDIVKPPADKVFKPGDWNSGRIYVRSGLIQHWLNGKKVAEVEAFDENGKPTQAWIGAIAASKFKEYEGFGVQPRGSIALQDHGDAVSYKEISIRRLDEPVRGETALFNGKDLTGWTAIVPDLAAKKEDPAKPWTVKDGVLACSGTPKGYLRSNEKYTNFVLRLQWRFDPARGAGNSGVLLRANGEDKVWPRCLEAQLESGNAGDFWNIGGMKLTGAPDRTKGANTCRTHGAERPLGQWNQYEILCQRGTVTLYVNGEVLNRATDCEVTPGYICLQSEGSYIEFRDIRLVPLP